MLNLFKNLFKKKEQEKPVLLTEAPKEMGTYLNIPIYVTPSGLTKGLPMLTGTEIQTLFDFLEGYIYIKKPFSQSGLTSNKIRVLRSLIKKGYLVKPKRGEYRLTFVKYDSDK